MLYEIIFIKIKSNYKKKLLRKFNQIMKYIKNVQKYHK